MWYAVLALSFLSCSLNPVGIAGLAMHILKPHDIYSTQLGWALTAGSFVIALMGFIATERVAYLERNRRALEFASLAACGAASPGADPPPPLPGALNQRAQSIGVVVCLGDGRGRRGEADDVG